MTSKHGTINSCVWQEYLAVQRGKVPHLPDIEVLSEQVIRILGGNPGDMQLQGTNTYLVGVGKSRILIDTGQGLPAWIANLTSYLQLHDLDVSHILLSHWHGDHAGGVADLISYDSAFAPRIFKCQPNRGQQSIEDGQVFRTEGATVKALFTPGHAKDHMCFLLEEENALFTGDNVLGHGYTVVEDLGSYMKSLRLMAAQQCLVGYPGHGAKIRQLPRAISQYMKHKEARESQVYSALVKSNGDRDGGFSTVKRERGLSIGELAYALHGEISEKTFRMALEPLLNQVLWKLAEEGKIGFEPIECKRRWYPIVS